MKRKIKVTKGSGNVFADIGVPNADEHFVVGGRRCRYVADLHHIWRSIARRDSGPHTACGYAERRGKFQRSALATRIGPAQPRAPSALRLEQESKASRIVAANLPFRGNLVSLDLAAYCAASGVTSQHLTRSS